MMTPRRARPRGMSLVEMMMAMAMVLVLATSAASLTNSASAVTGQAVQLEAATRCGQALMAVLGAVPYAASDAGGTVSGLFANVSATNDTDLLDTAGVFAQPTLATTAYDHTETDLPPALSRMLAAPPADGITYTRFWNVRPSATGNGVNLAVIVRWHSNGAWHRTAVLGTRYAP